MKLTKKQKEVLASVCDKHFFLVNKQLYTVDNKNDMYRLVKDTPEYFCPETLLTADIIEDENTFNRFCGSFFNRQCKIYAVCVDTSGRSYYTVLSSRSKLTSILREYSRVYAFAAHPHLIPLDAAVHTSKFVCIPEKTILCSYIVPSSNMKRISLLSYSEFVSFLMGDSGVALQSRMRNAIEYGSVFSSSSTVPAEDILSLPLWELTKKYSGLYLIPYYGNNADILWGRELCLSKLSDLVQYNTFLHELLRNNVKYFAVCAIKQEDYPALLEKYAPEDVVSVTINGTSDGKVYSYPVSEPITPYAVYQWMVGQNIIPTIPYSLLHNKNLRTYNDSPNHYLFDYSVWYLIVPDAKPTMQFIEMEFCSSAVVEALVATGYDVKLFQNCFSLNPGIDRDTNVPLADLIPLIFNAVLMLHLLLSRQELDEEASMLLGTLISYGFYCDDMVSFDVTHEGKLLSPQVASFELSRADNISDENADIALLINTIYGLATKSDVFDTAEDNNIYLSWNARKRYFKLMCSGHKNIPFRNFFERTPIHRVYSSASIAI